MNKFWMAMTGICVLVIGLAATGVCYGGSGDNEIRNGTISVENRSEADFPALVTLSPDQAVQKALAASNGSVLKTELEDENGFLVYNVEVVSPEKRIVEVKVDAGSGKILAMEKDQKDTEDTEAGD